MKRKATRECLGKVLPHDVAPGLVRRTLERCPTRTPKDREALGCELLATLLRVCEGRRK